MKCKLLLSLLSLIIVSLIISSGCGGENGITQPSSSLTPAVSDKIAYIIINVKWPKRDIPGSFIISSSDNKNELTASMTEDTKRIEIRIYEDKSTPEGDPIGTEPIGMATIKEPDTTAKIPVHIKNNSDDPDPNDPNTPGILPVVPVKIWAGAFSDIDGDSLVNPISETLKDYTVVVGNNAINFELGDYKLKVEPSTTNIALGEQVEITATLTIEDSTGNSVAAEGALNEKDIEFTIWGKKTIVKTDKNGKAITNVMGEQLGPMPIVAEFKPIPQETIRAENSVDVTGPVGRYVLTVTSNTDRIILSNKPAGSKTSIQANAANAPPPGEAEITANLVYIGPSQPGEPTPIPISVEGKEINFTSTSGTMEPVSATTGEQGNCTTTFLAINPGTVTIKGNLKDDPGTTGQCSIQVDRDYYLVVEGEYASAIPDFKTVDNIQQLLKKAYIVAWLRKPGNDSEQSLIAAEGVALNFTLDGYGTLIIKNNGITDENGYAKAEVDFSGYTGETTVSTVTVSFSNPVNSNYNSENCNAGYYVDHKYVDTFENYPVNTCASDLSQFIYDKWSAGGEALSGSKFENVIDSYGADNTGQSIKLYSNSSSSYLTSEIDDWHHSVDSYYNMTKELRFYIRLGNRTNYQDATSSIELGGMSAEGSIGGITFLSFKDDIEEGKKIYDARGDEIIASYPTNWYPVRIQILGNQYTPPQKLKVNYWLGEEFKKSIYLENIKILYDSNVNGRSICSLTLASKNNTVWFDQIEYYHDFYNWTP